MSNNIFVEGNLFVQSGIMYVRNIVAGATDDYKEGAKILAPKNGTLTIRQNCGSIFTNYYVSGGVSCSGIESGNIYFFADDHRWSYERYKSNIDSVLQLLDETKIPNDREGLFYQQQYISVFGALELYLYETFMRQVCNNETIYKRVIQRNIKILEKNKNSHEYKILKGKDRLTKEITFISKVQYIVYHNHNKVDILFKTAFNVDANILSLASEIKIRHDLVHRMGHDVNLHQIHITKDQVLDLVDKVNGVVDHISTKIFEQTGSGVE